MGIENSYCEKIAFAPLIRANKSLSETLDAM